MVDIGTWSGRKCTFSQDLAVYMAYILGLCHHAKFDFIESEQSNQQ